MLNMNAANLNFNGSSDVEDVTIATFSAGFSGEDVYFSFNIPNKDVYAENVTTFNTDLIAFKDQVMHTVENI